MARMFSDSFSNVRNRLAQLRAAFAATRASDPRLVPYLVAAALAAVAVAVLVGVLLNSVATAVVAALLLAPLAAMVVFGRRATAAQLHAIEGRPGAAAAGRCWSTVAAVLRQVEIRR
jgi:Flp pilus assembly protein TadB